MRISLAGLYHDDERNDMALRRVIDHARPSCVTFEYSAEMPCGGFFDRLCGEREKDYHALFERHGRDRAEVHLLLMTMGINGFESTVRHYTGQRRFLDKESLERITREKGLPLVFADEAITLERWHAHCLEVIDDRLASGLPIKALIKDLESALAGGSPVKGIDVPAIVQASYAGYSHPSMQEFLNQAYIEGHGFIVGERDAGMAAAVEREAAKYGRVLHVGGAAHGMEDTLRGKTLFSRLKKHKPDRYLIEKGDVAGYSFFGDRMI